MKRSTLFSIVLAASMLLTLMACTNKANEPESTPAPTETAEAGRTMSYTIKLGGKDTIVYLNVSDNEIELWDSASGGKLVAVAKYAKPMNDAADALKSCDFSDLDGDGNSELTADFGFSDGTSAKLTWFYVDGGFTYNEEFSVLPGDEPKGE